MVAPTHRKGQQQTVGIRELRQNLTKYLRRVQAGETLEVTEHGHPVAVLAPLPPPDESVVDRLIREGRARPGQGDLLDVKPLPPITDGPTLSRVLAQQRDEERF